MTGIDDAEPPAVGPIRPDETVLDELSRVFGSADEGSDTDITTPTDPDVLAERVTDRAEAGGGDADPDPSGGPAARTTITIGADDLGSDTVDPVPLDEALGRPARLADDDPSHPSPTDPEARSTISIVVGDELPDAVYLDGELERGDDSGGTVFIDDDGTGDAIAPKEATSPGIEPRFRQRRIGVRRAEGRRRLKWVVLALVVVLVLVGVLTVLGSDLFAIDDVSVGGNVYTDENRLAAVVDDLLGTPVLLADTAEAERELEAIPWVEDARVRAIFPDRATIEIRERTPVATMRGGDGRFRVLDAEGRVLDVIEGQPVAYVLLAGPGTLDLAAGEFAPLGPSSAASLVTKLTPTIRPRVESIEVTDDGSDLVINLAPADDGLQTSTIKVRFGSAVGDNDQIEKLVRLEQKLDGLPDRTISEINVATNEVTVR
ncbi:MAG: FtsQ-type POTRA domain-containing protein [Ilumatobacter sp.]|nr:FtsQ-type POTRA domain-containing protein [Ilumatobacter sp.]